MNLSKLARGALVTVTLSCFGLPQAEAVEIFSPPGLAAHMNDDMVTQVRGGRGGGGRGGGMHRGGGGMHRGGGGMHRGGGGMHSAGRRLWRSA